MIYFKEHLKKISMKHIIFYFLTLLLCISYANAGFYNASYTNLNVEKNGWCKDLEITFKVYNETDYSNKEKMLSKLCSASNNCFSNECHLDKNKNKEKCENCSNCYFFREIRNAKVIIYDGPLRSRPILFETKTNSSSEFSYIFKQENQYLIEIISEEDKKGNKINQYNDYEELLSIINCNIKNNPAINTQNSKNQTFNYLNNQIVLEIKNTNINQSSQIQIKDKPQLTNMPKDVIQSFSVINENPENQYDKIDLKIKKPEQENFSLLMYNQDKYAWDTISNFKTENGYIIIDNASTGIYSITSPLEKQDDIKSNQSQIEQNISNQTNKTTTVNTKVPAKKSNTKTILIILLLGLAVLIFLKFKKKSSSKPQEALEITNIDLAFEKTKEYVNKYKKEFSKDQIYRKLIEAQVPKETIDKVFEEEF